MNQKISLPVFSIERHRLTTDGKGVTTLVGAYGCPLQCKYCINPHAWNPDTLTHCTLLTPDELYEKVKIDHLYFLASGGGVTFGGGESLLHSSFIQAFRAVCPKEWLISVETSLNVPVEQLDKAIGVVDDYIVDIKDMNPIIYEAYTSMSMNQVKRNLCELIKKVPVEHIKIRVPQIPSYNNSTDITSSEQILRDMGFTQIEVFPYIIRNKS